MVFRCVSCSTNEHPVFVEPVEMEDEMLHCPICFSVELEEVDE